MAQASAESPIWTAEGPEKRAQVQRMFSEIAPTYDLLNDLMCARMHRRWRAFAVRSLRLPRGATALDVCCGTGEFVRPLRRAIGPGGKVLAIDFAIPMLKLGQAKEGAQAQFISGDALSLPVQSQAFDGVTIGWGIRNVADIDAAHREIFRVLKPGGRFVSVDMAKPRNVAVGAVSRLIFKSVVPVLGSLLGQQRAYTYLPESTDRFASREQLTDSMRRAGFQEVAFADRMMGNICVVWGQRP